MTAPVDMTADQDVGGIGASEYLPPGFAGQYRQPFVYNVNFLNIGIGAVVTGNTNINNDSFFVVTEQAADIWDAATGNTTNTQPDVAPMLVRIIDSSSGKYQSDIATPVAAWFGNGKRPYIWIRRAQFYRPGGQIQVELTNNMATAQNVRLSFVGFKVYNVPDSSAGM